MKKILITGANGMVGSGVVREFINKYDLVLVDPFINRLEQYKRKARIIRKDLTEVDEWQKELDGVYCVVHLAAAVHWVPKTKEEKQKFIQINAKGTRVLYDVCARHGVERFLFFSTNDVYEPSDRLITEETPVNPRDIYGKSKLLAEQYLLEESRKNKTSICIFRPASIYGENDKGSMKSLISFCKKGIVPMIGNGNNKKALLYLKDIIQAIEKYIESKDSFNGEIFNISSGDFEYKEIIDTICNIFKFKPIRIYIPAWFCKNIACKIGLFKKLTVAGETKIVSNDKANKMIGYKRKYDLKNGLEDAKSYYSNI